MKKYRGIIFDFDGVLFDSELPYFRIIQDLCHRQYIEIPDNFIGKTAGLTTPAVFQKIKENYPLKDIDSLIYTARKAYKESLASLLLPVQSTTSFVKNYIGETILSIGSMSNRTIIEQTLAKFNLRDKFGYITSQDDVSNFKPHPEVYQKALEKQNLRPEDAIVIEDSIHGIQAALAAGISVYAVQHAYFTKRQLLKIGVSGFITNENDLYELAL